MMKIKKYYQVTAIQLFFMAMVTGVFAGAIITINTIVREHLTEPVVIVGLENKCIDVVNYRNGDAFTCNDVDVILRSYRKKQG